MPEGAPHHHPGPARHPSQAPREPRAHVLTSPGRIAATPVAPQGPHSLVLDVEVEVPAEPVDRGRQLHVAGGYHLPGGSGAQAREAGTPRTWQPHRCPLSSQLGPHPHPREVLHFARLCRPPVSWASPGASRGPSPWGRGSSALPTQTSGSLGPCGGRLRHCPTSSSPLRADLSLCFLIRTVGRSDPSPTGVDSS